MKDSRLKDIYRLLYKSFGPQYWWPGETPFEIAIGAILTQNTNWGNVEKAINNLKKEKMLSAKAINDMPATRLASLIKPAGYFNVKAKRLKSFVSFLCNDYHGSMKRLGEDEAHNLRHRLLSVNGIGPETADSIMLYALDKSVFVIDAYTKRALSRHNILKYEEPYERFQGLFHKSLKRDVRLFNEYHALFVRLGKTFCRTKPVCEGCPLSKVR